MDFLSEFVRSNIPAVLVHPDGNHSTTSHTSGALLAGSFDPLHHGHLQLAAAAVQFLDSDVHFELCICNVDKPALDIREIQARLQQFAGRHPVWLTQASTFVEKASLFPGATFVVGVDTAERIIDARYYAGLESGIQQALHSIRDLGCRFLVAGRRDHAGDFIRLPDLAVPTQYLDLFVEIPQSLFQADISSSQLRETDNSDG